MSLSASAVNLGAWVEALAPPPLPEVDFFLTEEQRDIKHRFKVVNWENPVYDGAQDLIRTVENCISYGDFLDLLKSILKKILLLLVMQSHKSDIETNLDEYEDPEHYYENRLLHVSMPDKDVKQSE